MKNRIKRLSVLTCALALLASVSLAQQAESYKELPNFHKVSDALYRGAQPLGGGVKKLAGLGIKTIINLRGEDDLARQEKKDAEAAGLHYFSVSMAGLSAPSDEQIARVMAIIDKPENQPVFIHCKRGSDRTGTIAAVYRISHDGWNPDRALAEAKTYGMSWTEFGMRGYISDYNKRKASTSSQPAAATAATTK
ncbi:MAG TPA: tyrosine-protein phosphatase [Blastocatellia bacterium]